MIVIQIVLTIVFGSSILKGIDVLRRKHAMDRLLFTAIGLLPVFIAFIFTLIGLQAATIVYLWYPFPAGAVAGYLALFLSWAETVFGIVYTSRNPDAVAEMARASRKERGLDDMGFTPRGVKFTQRMVVLVSAPAVLWTVLLLFYQLRTS